ncbi:MAG: alpha/beta fold hydrolase [Promethearchaeota archaeon]
MRQHSILLDDLKLKNCHDLLKIDTLNEELIKVKDTDYWFHYVLSENPHEIKKVIQEKYIELDDGTPIHLDVYEPTQNVKGTVIFIHGTAVYSKFYAEFCYRLHEEGYCVISPDLIGHGLSGGKRGHFTMKKFSETIQAVINHVIENHGNKIVLMGSSLGGIATLYATAHDIRITGAICHNAAIFNEKAYKKIIKPKGLLRILVHLIPFMARLFPTWRFSVFLYLDFSKLAHSKFTERIEFLLNDPLLTKKYTLTALRAQLKEPLAKPIEEITTPILIINGEHDFLFSLDYMKEIQERLSNAPGQLVVIKGASHLIFQEYIDEALKEIIPWIESLFSHQG